MELLLLMFGSDVLAKSTCEYEVHKPGFVLRFDFSRTELRGEMLQDEGRPAVFVVVRGEPAVCVTWPREPERCMPLAMYQIRKASLELVQSAVAAFRRKCPAP